MTFSSIAEKLLIHFGFKIDKCGSQTEAIKAQNINSKYPVYFSGSTTTGEKPYEEFFTNEETVNLSRHNMLGVIQTYHTKRFPK